MKAVDKLLNKNNEGKFVCVGLDTDVNKIPKHLHAFENPELEFNRLIIETTSQHAAAFKINFAFYEKKGIEGIKLLQETLSYIPSDLLLIADAKRGDIGNTSKMYADAVYKTFNFDSVTLNPLMGKDSIQPFLDYGDKLNFILALTSNPGSADFQKLKLIDGSFLFNKIIDKVNQWNEKNNCGIVFGATNTNELFENINSFGSLAVLLPGVGVQGGSLDKVVKAFKAAKRKKYLINVSRGIIYKSNGENFAEQAEKELQNMNDTVQSIINSE